MTDYLSAQLDENELRALGSIALAHVGDAVYELLVRTYLCTHGRATGKTLHRAAVELVRASAQARFAGRLAGRLTEEEESVFRRGRNANVHTIPHASDPAEYRQATALEALFGYLYLKGERVRISELFGFLMEGDHAS